LPLWTSFLPLANAGYFFVGDAAAILEPSSSHGVLKALMCGIQASHLAAAIKCGRAPHGIAAAHYTYWVHDMFDHDVVQLEKYYAQLSA
jgi:flavin-dependent dehydrogenase